MSKCPHCGEFVGPEADDEFAKHQKKQAIRTRAYVLDPRAFESYRGQPRSFKSYMDYRRTKAREQARREYEREHE
jgi:hypothetical protein